jgi:hypothetical protein
MKSFHKLHNEKAWREADVASSGFGDAGAGSAKVQCNSEIDRVVLIPNKIRCLPTYHECPDIGAMAKNPFWGRRMYRLNEDRLIKFHQQLFFGKKRGRIVCGIGGGSGMLAACSTKPATSLVPYLDLRFFLSEKPFFDGSEDGERAYLSMTFSLSLLKGELPKEVGVDLIAIPRECHSNYAPLDSTILDIDYLIALTSQIPCGLDREDWMRDPACRIRTYGFASILVVPDPGLVRDKVVTEVIRLTPFLKPELLKKSPVKALGAPIILLCGPGELLREVTDFLTLSQSHRQVMSLEERDKLDEKTDELIFRKLAVIPLESPKIFIAGIYPVNPIWWLELLSDRKRACQELLQRVKDGSNGSTRIDILRRMIKSSGYSVEEIEEFFCDGRQSNSV